MVQVRGTGSGTGEGARGPLLGWRGERALVRVEGERALVRVEGERALVRVKGREGPC